MFLEGSETFISAILASRMKIRALNYGADPEILTSGLHYPYFHNFLIFQKIFFGGIEPKYFSNWSNVKNFQDLNVLERVLIAVKILSKNIENQKSYSRFCNRGGRLTPPPRFRWTEGWYFKGQNQTVHGILQNSTFLQIFLDFGLLRAREECGINIW